MIASVTFEKTMYADLPNKFEAGTPHIAGVAGLGAAIDYVAQLGLEKIQDYEEELLSYAHAHLTDVPGLRIIGTAAKKNQLASGLAGELTGAVAGATTAIDAVRASLTP